MATKNLKTGIWARSSRLLGMAARVAAQEVGQKSREVLAASKEAAARSELQTRIAQAKVIADSLSQLKGAAMKAGQLLSIDSSDLLPPEAIEVLSKLQGRAEPVDFAVLRDVLWTDLGEEAAAKLASLQERPAASASIGQVHRAIYEEQPVAVKIQYPGIAESIDSDIGMLEKLADSWLLVARNKIDMTETFEEIRQTLHLEADYAQELAHLQEYRRLVSGDARFTTPRAFPELCGKRVLTMTWEEGVPLKDWIVGGPSLAEREALARAVLDLYCLEFFDWGFVQTDPNHGNFLMRPSDGSLVLLDFGATLRYDEAFRQWYKELLRTLASRDIERIVEAGIRFELLDAREPAEARELFGQMMISSMEPFEPALQPFTFKDPAYARRARDIGRRFTRALKYSPPPRQLLFLHRKLGGVFQLLRRLDVRIDLVPYWERMVSN